MLKSVSSDSPVFSKKQSFLLLNHICTVSVKHHTLHHTLCGMAIVQIIKAGIESGILLRISGLVRLYGMQCPMQIRLRFHNRAWQTIQINIKSTNFTCITGQIVHIK